MIFKEQTDAKIRHEKLKLVSNEAENYCKLKESIRIKKNQIFDIKKTKKLIEYGKRIEIKKLNKMKE